MAQAMIQFTQGANIGGNGQSVLGFVRGLPVTLTDAAGPGATSWSWQIVSWPSPLSSPPSITNPTAQVATVDPPTLDGVYLVKLTRVDLSGTTVDIRFFGVADEDGMILPSPGQSSNMHNIGATPTLAIAAGWAGRADATTNDQLDAYLRFVRTRVGRWVGNVQRINYTSSSASVVPYTDGTDKPYRILLATGTGAYTEELVTTGTAIGKTVRYLLSIASTSGGFVLHNGVGGPAIATFTAPVSGTSVYDAEAVYDGTDWLVSRVAPVSLAANAYVRTNAAGNLIGATTVGITDLSITSQTRGDVLFFNGTQWTRLAAGSSGQLLQTNGAGADPTWATVSTTPSGSAGGDLSGTYPSPTVAKLNGVTAPGSAPLAGQFLKALGATSLTYAALTAGDLPSATVGAQGAIILAGDLSGSAATPAVVKINGASVPASGALTTGHVLQVSGVSALAYDYIGDANVASGAGIAGTKISPNFGAQNILTTGTITGAKLQVASTSGPTLTSGTGVPVSNEANGSLFLRTDGTDASSALYSRQAGSWFALGGGQPTGSAGGDLSGTYPNPTVAKANGATLPAAGALTTGHVLQVSGVSALSYGYVADANVSASAAIAGTKINPSFGSQNILTTGTLTVGVATVSQILFATGSSPQWAAVQQINVAISDHTLSAAEYGHPVIEFYGNTPADRTAIFPLLNANAASTSGSVWFVRNATTGGFNVNVKGPTGLTVQVPFGGSAIVYTDGTNFYSLGSAGSGGGTSGPASGDLSGSYPNPVVAFLSGVSGIVQAVAPFFAIDSTIVTAYTFAPASSNSPSGDAYNYIFQGQHGKPGITASAGGSVQVIGGNAGSAAAFGGGLIVTLGNNTYSSTHGGYIQVLQHSGISGVLQVWEDGTPAAIAHVLDTGVNIASGKKLYMGGTGVNPVTLTSIPTLTSGSATPVANEPTGSVYMKTGAADTTDVLWVRQGTTWASLGAPSGSASGDLSGTYPGPTVAKINGATVPVSGSLTTSHILMVSGAAALSYGYLANANVSASAAIAGTKISPDFGGQTVQTTGTVLAGTQFTVGSSGPTITKGTGAPATTPANGSLYIQTDGTDGSNGLYTRQGGAWYQVGAGAGGPPTGPAGGDLSGTYPNPTVAKINGTSVNATPSANTVLVATSGTVSAWNFIVNANISGSAAIAGSKITPDFGSQTLTAGKLTVQTSGPTITKGTGVPASATEPNGSLFMRTDGTDGTTALYSYQGGSWVAVGTGGGATPTGPASGDLSGSYPGPTVAKLNGVSAPGFAPSSGHFIKATSPTQLTYTTISTADLPNFSAGDLTNTYASPQVTALTGSGGVVTMRTGTFRWEENQNPLITQATATSDHATHALTITSQAPWASAALNTSPGNIVLTVPSPVGAGAAGKVSFSISGAEQAYVGLNQLVLGASTALYLGGPTLPAISSGVGAPSGSAPDGSFYLVQGSTVAATTAYVRANGAWSALSVGGTTNASAVAYVDTNTPTFGSTNVQGVLDALKSLGAPGGTRLSARTYAAAYGVSGAQSTGTTAFTGIGLIRFNPNHYFPTLDGGSTKRIKFKAYLESTNGLTAQIRLYDLTSASVVTSSTLSTSSATPVLLSSVDISGNLAAGAEHDYEVQIALVGSPTAGDQATCKMAQLEVTYV